MKKCWKCAEEIQDAAVACRYCHANQGRQDVSANPVHPFPKKQWLAIGGGLALLMIIGVALSPKPVLDENGEVSSVDEASSDPASVANLDAPEALAVTAVELADAFDNNELQAMQRYGNAPLAVTGVLKGVDLDFDDDPTVKLESGKFLSVQAQFDKERGSDLARFNSGDQITVLCNRLTEIMGTPMLNDCWVG